LPSSPASLFDGKYCSRELSLKKATAQKKLTSSSPTRPSSGRGSLFTSLRFVPFETGFTAFAFFSTGRSSSSSVSSVPTTDFSGDFLALFLEAGMAAAFGVAEPFLVGVLGVEAPLLVCRPEERAPYLGRLC